MTSCAGPVSPHCSDDTTAEKVSLLSTKIVTGDMLPSNLIEGEASGKLMLFAEFKPPSWKTTATRVEKMYEDSAAELRTEGCQQGGCYYRLVHSSQQSCISQSLSFTHSFPNVYPM